jgi:hypothetical protein
MGTPNTGNTREIPGRTREGQEMDEILTRTWTLIIMMTLYIIFH